MSLCSHTPSLSVVDSRGLPVRQVDFYRADVQDRPELRMTRQAFDVSGRLLAITDPRLDRPSTSTVYSLSDQPLLTDNVDAGWRLTLFGEAGQPLENRDSRGTLFASEYDELMRSVAIAETLDGEPARVSERFIYGDASAQWMAHNQCGTLLRRDDSAGSVWFSAYGLTGALLHQERRFLAPTGHVDWPQEPSQRDRLLEAERFISTSAVGADGDVIVQTDARGNCRFLTYACSGELKSTGLQTSGSNKVHVLVSDIHHDAMGAVEREIAGNGVVSTATYDAADGRLTRLLALTGEGQVLQDLNYGYDPIGNLVSVGDAAQPVSFFRNQRVEPVNRYLYDSLYRLIEATGREVAPVSHLPGLPDFQTLPLDPGNLIRYTQRFEYDAGGNLLARHHSGAQTWRMSVSSTSNRSLLQRADGTLPDEGQIAEAFDGNGNLKALQLGQAMIWDGRNQLREVTSVGREDGPDDSELYRYDGEGRRVRKVRVSQARDRALTAEVRYLPGLEIHRNEATGEMQHVLTVEAGRSSVRLLHWESGKPDGIENDQLRYSLSDHLGSRTLELDKDAKLISHEGYYPFGGTAWWAARSAVEAKYKTVRYSGKERDSTGLYYYGFRYYAPWLQRWVNPDPAGDVDGLNRYRMVGNNPITCVDNDGLETEVAARWKDAARRARSAVTVRTIVPGIIAVRVRGDNALFERIGIDLNRAAASERQLAYLSIDQTYRGKISGGDDFVNLRTLSSADIESVTRKTSTYTAVINGGFFNGSRKLDLGYPAHASVGKNKIDGKAKPAASVPEHHRGDYVKVKMDDSSYIHSAPQLSTAGTASFTADKMKRFSRFRFEQKTPTPGYLNHADQPNSRSAVSLPAQANSKGRTRLAVGLTESRDLTISPGYTLPEWAAVMSRLDRLDGTAKAGSSINLDGGASSTLAVIGREEGRIFSAALPDGERKIGNFLSFHKRKPAFWSRLK
ncbi:RHS repeat-associated core domain-containing protein [Pseudomonas sp. RC10]|uniref:RHS repeat-associated core domain-containing protein n=1 Tax=Pseudomonas bambusae TaxID=3139142 RepID=UPI003139F8D2